MEENRSQQGRTRENIRERVESKDLSTYLAHAILIGPYGTYARNISNANHLSPSGTVHTASTTAVKKPQKVETDIRAGRLRQWSEKMAKRTVRTSWTAACEVGMTFISSMEYFPVALSQRVKGWTEPEGCCGWCQYASV
jgi:hypothetical protein